MSGDSKNDLRQCAIDKKIRRLIRGVEEATARVMIILTPQSD